jgi:hypothetical protein
MLGFQSFKTAKRTLKGIEAMVMMLKEQTVYLAKSFQDQVQLFNRLTFLHYLKNCREITNSCE